MGGAAGTISKSMSAYNMKVSDAIYGPCDRYVCRQRLEDMLDHEHRLNSQRLKRDKRWHPRDEDSQIILHVRMLDHDTPA